MTPFTDKDLAEYKKRALYLDRQHTLNLIARLEAAEKVCQSIIDNWDEPNFSYSMATWRKAAGK